ncbi:MAG TPA: GNAT family N-acetyltransferase [Nitrolancea sp.]|nr:GNAT family N-acetyltransferase [Nitrolancea sp.]
MPIAIRSATRDDAGGIVAVAADVWPEDPLDVAEIERLIAETPRATLVAELDGHVVGFVDGFTTFASNDASRWEVDLLAVASHAQGCGLGRQLVEQSVQIGLATGAAQCRALIRIGNVASERVFMACGFSPDHDESDLLVTEGFRIPSTGAALHVVPVQTFRYSGIWLEEVNADALRSLNKSMDGSVVGAVIPVADRASHIAAVAVGMEPAGRFRFWRRSSCATT